MMVSFESPAVVDGWCPSVTPASGHEPSNEHPRAAERLLGTGGNRLSLIGATPDPVDAGAPTRVPGPGVESRPAGSAAALRIA